MTHRPRDPPQVDLAHFSAAECAKIWDVLQKDFHLRFREEQRLQRLRSQLAKAGDKALTLGADPNFNDKYCIICFSSFWVLFKPKERCFVCMCHVCHSCSRYVDNYGRWLCSICEEEKTLAAKQCLWFYDGTAKTFVVGGSSSTTPLQVGDENSDPLADQLRRYLQEFVARIKQEDGEASGEEIGADVARRNYSCLPNKPARGHLREEVLKRVTAHQVMRFHQRIAEITTEVERFLRSDVRYEIPEAGVNGLYDQKMDAFHGSVANVLRNFSQSLYIAIEGHHSKTGEPVEDVHLGVQQILQDEVENLVGCRVDIPNDDDAVSMVSDDVGASNDQGATIHDRLADCLLNKLLNDHQTFLDDQHLTASDMYTETALERVLSQKSERRNFGEFPDGLFGRAVDPDLLSAGGSAQMGPRDVAQKTIHLDGSIGSSGSGANWRLAGRPAAKCSDSLRDFGLRNDHSDDFSDGQWKDLGDLDDESDDNISSLSSNLGVMFPSRTVVDRKLSVTSLDFDDVYQRNLTFTKDTETAKERLEQSSRSEDSGVHVTGSSPPTLERQSSLGFSRMDWSFNERSDPHFVAKSEHVDVVAGECAVIEVVAEGSMPIDIFWYRCSRQGTQQLEEKDRVEFQSAPDHPGKSSLLLWDVRKEDAGEYLATAVNENGSTQQGFKVQVTDRKNRPKAPKFVQEVSDEVYVREGGTARLFCKVQGRPKPRVQFLKDGEPLRCGERTKIMTIGQVSFGLSIFDIRTEDEGTYVCLATNCGGSVRCEAQVKISTSDLFYTDPTPDVDMSPAVKVKAQVSRLSSQTSFAPASSVKETQSSSIADRVFKRQDSSTRKSFRIPDASAKKEEEVMRERQRVEEREREMEERNRQMEQKRKEREEREVRERLERESREWEERDAKEKEEREKKKREEEMKREKNEKERLERRARREKERRGRETKDRKERELKERMEKQEKEKRAVEERIRLLRIERERREQEEKERREREERERRERGEMGEEEDEELMEEERTSGVFVSIPNVQVDDETHFPYGGSPLRLSSRSVSPTPAAAVSDIKTLIESGKLNPAYAPNMKASFRTRKFPSVPAIRDQLSRRGAYGKRPTPVPVKIVGKKTNFRKSNAHPDPSESKEDFRTVTLKATGMNLSK